MDDETGWEETAMEGETGRSLEAIMAEMAEKRAAIEAAYQEIIGPMQACLAAHESDGFFMGLALGAPSAGQIQALEAKVYHLNGMVLTQALTIAGLVRASRLQDLLILQTLQTLAVDQATTAGFTESVTNALVAIKGRLGDVDEWDDGEAWKRGAPG
jgi:hypothetical protein